jgi:hypothetical protein
MNQPGFGEGILVAVIGAFVVSIVHRGVGLFLPPVEAAACVCAAAGFGYLLYLLGRSQRRGGRLLILLSWILLTIGVWVMALGVWSEILVQLAFVWLVRSACFHTRPLLVLMDLGLVILGLAGSIWALEESGSLFLSLWTFLLIQALFTTLPGATSALFSSQEGADGFEAAEHTAERALQCLSRRD